MMKKGDSTYYYAIIERDKDICVILYTLHATFKNPILQKYLPSPEVCEIVLFYSTICCRSDISISLFW